MFSLSQTSSLSISDSSLSNREPVTGILALYTLALKSSCYDLSTITFTVGENAVSLLTHLKMQMELEKEHIACKFSYDLLMGSHKKQFFILTYFDATRERPKFSKCQDALKWTTLFSNDISN